MKSLRIKIFHSCLVVILGFSLFLGETGYWLYANIYQSMLKSEIAEALCEISPDDAQLVPVKFSLIQKESSSVTWITQGKEFLFEGEMYDIIRTTCSADSITYFCFHDIRENSYRLKLENQASQTQGSLSFIATPIQTLSFQYLPSVFIYRYAPRLAFSSLVVEKSLSDPLLAVDSPPPRFNNL